MATTNSIVSYPGLHQQREKRGKLTTQSSLFQRDDDELSIDLNDGALFGGEAVRAGYTPHQPLNMDKSFMSDFPDDFLTPMPRGLEAAPASGADGNPALFAGQKRRRVVPQFAQKSDPSLLNSAQGPFSTQVSSGATSQAPAHGAYNQADDQFDILSMQGTGEMHQQPESTPCGSFFNYQATDSSLDSIAAMRKSKNREAAKRSRQKKKAEQNSLAYSNDRILKENNKLKLDNAALRAENVILKRQLSYFENLFAKKTQAQPIIQQNQYEHYSSATQHTLTRSSGSVISGGQITQQQRRPDAARELQFSQDPHAASVGTEEEGEISFVLERNVGNSPTGNKLGLFSLALIMCICCFSSFFGPQTVTSLADTPAVQMNTVSGGHGGSMSLQEAATDPSSSPEQVTQMSSEHEGTEHVSQAQLKQAAVQLTFMQVVLNAIWINLLKLVFLVAFAFCLLLFPKEELVQWAARKPFFRKIFDFSDVPIAAQTKFIKSDKLV